MRGLILTYAKEGKAVFAAEGIMLIFVQYPMRNIAPLKKIFEDKEGIFFVDNERVVKDAMREASYKECFVDMCGGDFDHCTPKANKLLAKNIVDVKLEKFFAVRRAFTRNRI